MATGDGEGYGGGGIFPVRTNDLSRAARIPPTTVMGERIFGRSARNSGQKLQRSGELLGENFLIPPTSWNLDSAWSIRTRGPRKLFRQFRRDYNFIIRQPRVKLCRNFRRFRTVSLWISIDFIEFVLSPAEESQEEGKGRSRGEKDAFLWFFGFRSSLVRTGERVYSMRWKKKYRSTRDKLIRVSNCFIDRSLELLMTDFIT